MNHSRDYSNGKSDQREGFRGAVFYQEFDRDLSELLHRNSAGKSSDVKSVQVCDVMTGAVHHYLRAIFTTEHDIPNLVGETWLKALRRYTAAAEVEVIQKPRGWMMRVAYNAGLDMMRNHWTKNKRGGDEIARSRSYSNNPLDNLIEAEERELLMRAVEKLSEEQRRVFDLRIHGLFTYKQIAKELDRPIGTVKTHMRAAQLKLAAIFGKEAPLEMLDEEDVEPEPTKKLRGGLSSK